MTKRRWHLLALAVILAWCEHQRVHAQRSGPPVSIPPNQWKKVSL